MLLGTLMHRLLLSASCVVLHILMYPVTLANGSSCLESDHLLHELQDGFWTLFLEVCSPRATEGISDLRQHIADCIARGHVDTGPSRCSSPVMSLQARMLCCTCICCIHIIN